VRKTLIEDLIQYVCGKVEIQEIQARHCLPTDFLDNSYGPVHKQPSFCRSGGDTRSVESTTRRRPRAPETGSTLGIGGRWVSLRCPSSKEVTNPLQKIPNRHQIRILVSEATSRALCLLDSCKQHKSIPRQISPDCSGIEDSRHGCGNC
jgi:hypothetical protein